MSMKADAEGKAYDDINVTPMVDLYLVLLLIFIIMTTAGLQGFKAHLPKELWTVPEGRHLETFGYGKLGETYRPKLVEFLDAATR